MIEKILKTIKEHNKIALFMHKMPDGDTISSSYGLALALIEAFPKKKIVVVGDYDYLKKNFGFLPFKKPLFRKRIDKTYLTIVGDVAIKERIMYFDEYNKGVKKICFDHHQNKINFDASVYWPEPNWPASSLQAVEIAFALKKKFTEKTAIALLTGILTDTGFFKYSTNNPHPVESYAKLLKMTTSKGMEKFYQMLGHKTKYDLEVQGYIYKNVKYKNGVAYVLFKNAAIKKYGYNTIKMKVNMISNIEGTHAWGFFMEAKESKDFPWKVSLRTSSKNVNQVAIKHHGGGHIKASGCQAKNLPEVEKIINELGKI